jgi:PIN domain nuclease of toxin-antitoxin system
VIVLDTHTTIWWTADPKQLSKRATAAIAKADRIGLPAIIFWEVSILVRKGRLDLTIDSRPMAVRAWADALCAMPLVEPIPISVELALLADSLAMHPDPADRFIVAAAVRAGCPLVTRDKLIRPLGLVETIW